MIQPKRIERDKNPLWPLPTDYYELGLDGQRLARINGVSQWRLKSRSLEERGSNYTGSLRLFDAYYLSPDLNVDFNPYFYPKDPLPSPFYHELISHHGAIQRLLIAIGPRGGAKSMLCAKNMLMRLITHPAYSYTYCTSTQTNAAKMSELLRGQITQNSRLADDYGRLAPKRGEAIFSGELSYLTNRSWVQFLSIDSRIRGNRPACFMIDDPEWDPKASTSMSVVRQQMDHMLFSVILPTVMEEDASVIWYATFVSKQHYAWIAAGVDEEGHAHDARFEHWYRIIIRAVEESEKGELLSCWPEKWPATKDDRLKMAVENDRYYNMVSMEEIKSLVGPRVWQSEYMANPGQGEDLFFGTLVKDEHGYWLESVDELAEQDPLHSKSYICWKNKDGDINRMLMSEFCTVCKFFTCVDTSYTSGPTSDYKCCAIMAMAPGNVLFVMDLWAKQCDQRALEEATWAKCEMWRVPVIGIEYVSQGIALYNSFMAVLQTRSTEISQTEWMPRIMKLKPGYTEKSAKIAGALALRFHHGLIKLPFWRRNQRPWRDLFEQIEEFNPDVPDGGLQHDDCIDTVHMHTYMVKARVRMPEAEKQEPKTPAELLAAGVTEIHGVPIASSIDWRTDVPLTLMKQLYEENVHGDGTKRSKV